MGIILKFTVVPDTDWLYALKSSCAEPVKTNSSIRDAMVAKKRKVREVVDFLCALCETFVFFASLSNSPGGRVSFVNDYLLRMQFI